MPLHEGSHEDEETLTQVEESDGKEVEKKLKSLEEVHSEHEAHVSAKGEHQILNLIATPHRSKAASRRHVEDKPQVKDLGLNFSSSGSNNMFGCFGNDEQRIADNHITAIGGSRMDEACRQKLHQLEAVTMEYRETLEECGTRNVEDPREDEIVVEEEERAKEHQGSGRLIHWFFGNGNLLHQENKETIDVEQETLLPSVKNPNLQMIAMGIAQMGCDKMTTFTLPILNKLEEVITRIVSRVGSRNSHARLQSASIFEMTTFQMGMAPGLSLRSCEGLKPSFFVRAEPAVCVEALKTEVVLICGRRLKIEDFVRVVPSFVVGADGVYQLFGVFDVHGGSQAALHCKDQLHEALAEEICLTDLVTVTKWESVMKACFLKMDMEVAGICGSGKQLDGRGFKS
ncbi:hypothetical protein SUGI_0600760 [Cryptomeria japonica]|nr:hypothetical protein SUGI_0600760 [Cryptomeria japonica]